MLKRILIVDDFRPVQTAVATLLANSFEVVGTVSDGQAAIDAVSELKPDLVILDISMPGRNGLEVARELKSPASPTKVVFLTVQQDSAIVAACLAAGAQGYVVKSLMESDLIPAVSDALSGRIFVSHLSVLVGLQTRADVEERAVRLSPISVLLLNRDCRHLS